MTSKGQIQHEESTRVKTSDTYPKADSKTLLHPRLPADSGSDEDLLRQRRWHSEACCLNAAVAGVVGVVLSRSWLHPGCGYRGAQNSNNTESGRSSEAITGLKHDMVQGSGRTSTEGVYIQSYTTNKWKDLPGLELG